MSSEILTSTLLSSNSVWGQLGTTNATDVLDGCRKRRVTGEVIFHAGDRVGKVELRAGSVERVVVGGVSGDAAMAQIAEMEEGTFEVVQRLPDLEGVLGSAAEFQGELGEVPLIQVMRHVEAHALTVTITVIAGWDRGVIVYRDGDIATVEVNGEVNADRIGELVKLASGKFRVAAGVLEIPVPARRAPRRAPTEPFHVGHVAELRRAKPVPVPVPVVPVVPSPSPSTTTSTTTTTSTSTSTSTGRSTRQRVVGAVMKAVRRGVDLVEARLTRV